MSRKGGGAVALQKDVPWRQSGVKPIPKIHHSPVLRVAHTPYSNYALAISKHPDPVGSGLASDAIVEAAGPDCIVPGQIKPVRLLGLKVFFLSFFSDYAVAASDGLMFIRRTYIEFFDSVMYLKPLFMVWPIEVDLKFLEPVGKELKLLGKFMDDAVNLMNKSFIDRISGHCFFCFLFAHFLPACSFYKKTQPLFSILQQTMVYQAAMQEEKLRKGPWHEEEDELLVTFVTLFGERRWDYIAKASGLKRSGKSCRLRWLNYLRPNIKHGNNAKRDSLFSNLDFNVQKHETDDEHKLGENTFGTDNSFDVLGFPNFAFASSPYEIG
ncbi:hypothetical protein WN943_003573 [Citrus x changshan-huyou]